MPARARTGFHPRLVCRVAGLPTVAIEALRTPRTFALAAELLELEARLQASGETVSETLYGVIGRELDPARRRPLIALRRDLFNDRATRSADLPQHLPAAVRETVHGHLELRDRLQDHRDHFAASYDRELETSRARFRDALADEDFQRALVLSSPSLFESQGRYRQAPLGRIRARERQIERGLLKYWTRMVMKATPFGTFCAVVPGDLEPAAGPPGPDVYFVGDPLGKRGLVRLNKALCKIVLHHLRRDPLARDRLFVRLNSTLRKEGEGTLVFLVGEGNREAFCRLPDHATLALIRDIIECEDAPMPLAALVRKIAERTGAAAPGAAAPGAAAPREAIRSYLDRLIEIGFLWLSADLPSQLLDWDRRLVERWSSTAHASVGDTVELLRELGRSAHRSSRAVAAERSQLLSGMHRRWRDFRQKHDIKMRVANLIFEDATADASLVMRRTPGLQAIERNLLEYVELTSRLSLQRIDQLQMRHFFDHHYGSAVEQVPLLSFYEDYYRQHYKQHLQRELDRRFDPEGPRPEVGDDGYDLANPFGLRRIERILQARGHLARLVAGRAGSGSDEIDLATSDLRRVVRDVELTALAGCSVAVLGELELSAGRAQRLVVRKGLYMTGFGKMFSRFLDLFPQAFQRSLMDANEQLGGGRLAELCDDAYYNANLHPPILPREICYPNVESRGSGSEILPSALVVLRNPDDRGSLRLLHAPTGRAIQPVDTGFMNPVGRPPLYKLLAAFTPAPSFRLAWTPAEQDAGAGPRVRMHPRVTYNGRLVLRRRSWHVPAPLLPAPRAGETQRDLFLRVARWRREHAIPREVYVRLLRRTVQPAGIQGAGPEKPALNLLAAHKPQYVDFSSPLLVSLFARAAPHAAPKGTSPVAILEERLPGEDALLRHGPRGLVTEVVLQLDFTGSEQPP